MTNVTPAQVFPGFTVLTAAEAAPAEGIFIPFTDIPNLTPAEADPTTGSFPKVLYEVTTASNKQYNGLAATARSSRMTITRTPPAPAGTDLAQVSTTVTTILDISNSLVAAEAA